MNFDANIEVLTRKEVNLIRWQDAAQRGAATEALEGLSKTLGQQNRQSKSFDGSHDGHREVFDVAGRFKLARGRSSGASARSITTAGALL